MSITFTDNTIEIENIIEEKAVAFLYEATGELEAQTKRNSRVATGQTKGAWSTEVDENKLVGYVGNTMENAIWEEFGTGEYAINNDGRKGGWSYQDDKGNWHFTRGKKPSRALTNAYESKKDEIQIMAEKKLKEVGDN